MKATNEFNLTDQIHKKAEELAKKYAPIYEQYGWKWAEGMPIETQISEHIKFSLWPPALKNIDRFNIKDQDHTYVSSGRISIIARTYENSSHIDLNIYFDMNEGSIHAPNIEA